MALTLSKVHVAMLALEGSLESFDEHADGPLGRIGDVLGYRDLYAAARDSKDGLALPWDPKAPHANRFWSSYATGQLGQAGDAEAEAAACWQLMVPLKGTSSLSVGVIEPRLRPAFSEAYAWPTALGYCRNYLVQDVEARELGDILAAGRDLQNRHDALNAIRKEFWGGAAAGFHSDVTVIVSVLRLDAASVPREKDKETLAALLDGLDVEQRPRILPDEGGGEGAEGARGIYCADGFRLIWEPSRARTPGKIHSVGCGHRNLGVGAMQAQMIMVSARQLANLRKDGRLPRRYEAVVERLGQCAKRFWSPFHRAWFQGQSAARAFQDIGL
jgi:hypothetical protein